MELSLKLDENGQVVVVEGKPVYVSDEGKEIEIDATALYTKVSELSSEAKKHRTAKAALKTELGKIKELLPYEELEDLHEWKKQADKNAETVANFDQKDLVDAKKVDEIKRAQNEAHEEEKRKILESFSTKESEFQETLKEKDDCIYDLMVSGEFARSRFFSGPEPVTILLPDIAERYFGHHYKVEKNPKGKLRVTGYLNDEPIYSTKNPGELGDFDEAMEAIIENYSMKDKILSSTGGGSGARGGTGTGDRPTGDAGRLQTMKVQYKEAIDNKDAKKAVVLKNRIFELERKIRSRS